VEYGDNSGSASRSNLDLSTYLVRSWNHLRSSVQSRSFPGSLCDRAIAVHQTLIQTSQPHRRCSRPLSDRSGRYNRGFLIKHKRKLTTFPVLRYGSGP